MSAALASVRYQDFIAKGEGNGIMITGASGGDVNSAEDFNPLWMSEFKKTNAYEVWERTTDPMLFDIVEPRHPCNEKPSVVADIGLRLSEGIQELKLEQQLAPTREAISRTITAGSTNFFKAVEGVRGRWQRAPSPVPPLEKVDVSNMTAESSVSSTPVEVSAEELPVSPRGQQPEAPQTPIRMSLSQSVDLSAAAAEAKAAIGSWGAGLGSFWSAKTSRFSKAGAFGSAQSSPSIPAQIPASGHVVSPSESSIGSRPSTSSVKTAAIEVGHLSPHEEVHDLQISDLDSLHSISAGSSMHASEEEDLGHGAAYATGMAV